MDIEQYSAFDEQCSKWGYTWTAYTVVTEDQWELTLFRLTNESNELDKLLDDVVVEIDDDDDEDEEDKEEDDVKIPILF